MDGRKNKKNQGFSLIELVIVVVIIGIIGAIAIPRMSRGAAGASDGALKANLSVLRNAIDLYAAEHGNKYPDDNTTIVDQLTQKTNIAGEVDGDGTGPWIYGPYLRSIPPLPVGPDTNKGETDFTNSQGTAGYGWVYTWSGTLGDAGVVKANTGAATDAAGDAYSTY